MDELNDRTEAEFFEAVKGNGETIKFSPEDIKKNEEWCSKLYKEEGEMEAMVRKEKLLAASKPEWYLTC